MSENFMTQEQLNPFGKDNDIDFIEQDEASYYAMADSINEGTV